MGDYGARLDRLEAERVHRTYSDPGAALRGALEAAPYNEAPYKPPTLRERMEADLAQARGTVARLEEMLGLIAAEPRIERFMELLDQRWAGLR